MIIHAGDLDTVDVFRQLSQIAPVRAVRGNMDTHLRSNLLPATDVVRVGEIELYVLHNLEHLDLDPAAAGFKAVIYGHTHVPEIVRRGEVDFINPGSPTLPRRGSRPSVGRITIRGTDIHAELVTLPR